jgi:hypothetical protein
MRWETRVHWLWGLFIPGRWFLLLIALGGASFGTFAWLGNIVAAIAFILLSIGSSGIFALWVHWRSFSLTIPHGEKALWERHGFDMIAERRINMNMVGSTEFQQTLLGRILDYGSLSVGALGGPYTWENLGNFRILRRIIESQGEWMPPPGRNLINMLTDWIREVIQLVSRLLLILRQISNSLVLEARIIIDHFRAPSYRRFLEFAEKILFSQNTRRYGNWVHMEGLSGSVFSSEEVRIYHRILKARRLITSDLRGRTQRHKRIRTLNDIRRHIPEAWFRRAVRAA